MGSLEFQTRSPNELNTCTNQTSPTSNHPTHPLPTSSIDIWTTHISFILPLYSTIDQLKEMKTMFIAQSISTNKTNCDLMVGNKELESKPKYNFHIPHYQSQQHNFYLIKARIFI